MHGPEKSFRLGNGIRFHGNSISIGFDDRSTVISVSIQKTSTKFRYPWITTENLKETTGVAVLMRHIMTKAYAIVPKYLPKISDLDTWGRQDIKAQAKKWPDDLEAAYDLFFLRYCEVTPRQACVSTQNETV
jgi:hypothetical protein